jgi:hypothetical protein
MKLLRSTEDIVAALVARQDALNIPHEILDELAGVPKGYSAKIACRMKRLGAISLPGLLGALGVALIMVPDTAQIERMQRRWTKRRRRPTGARGLTTS